MTYVNKHNTKSKTTLRTLRSIQHHDPTIASRSLLGAKELSMEKDKVGRLQEDKRYDL